VPLQWLRLAGSSWPTEASCCPVLAGNLKLFAADLLEEGSFDAAVAGSKFVFHVASPFFIETQDPQTQLVDPAVKGTTNLMNSVIKHKDTISRVVLTSSVAGARTAQVAGCLGPLGALTIQRSASGQHIHRSKCCYAKALRSRTYNSRGRTC
jgi:hypothetical protein